MWSFSRISAKQKKRQNQIMCRRCGLLHLKTLIACPHCGGLTDEEVKQLVNQRAKLRLALGRGMMIAAAVIFVVLLLINLS